MFGVMLICSKEFFIRFYFGQKIMALWMWTPEYQLWIAAYINNTLKLPTIPYYTQIFWSHSLKQFQVLFSKELYQNLCIIKTLYNLKILNISIMFLLLLSYQNCIEPFLESVQCSFFERTSLEFICYKKFIMRDL